MTAVEFETSESIDRGAGIEVEGFFHLIVVTLDVDARKKDGQKLDCWKITVGVLDGTVKGPDGNCKLRQMQDEIMLKKPNRGQKDGGEFCQKVLTRYLLVTGLIKEEQLGGKIAFDPDHACGRQFIAKYSKRKYKTASGEEREDCSPQALDVWHVDDPFVADVPKDTGYLAQIPKELRWNPETIVQAAAEQASEPTNVSTLEEEDYDDV